MNEVPPLTTAEEFALKWVCLCERFKLDPKAATALDFVAAKPEPQHWYRVLDPVGDVLCGTCFLEEARKIAAHHESVVEQLVTTGGKREWKVI